MNTDKNRYSPVKMNRREVLQTGIHAAAALSAGASLLQIRHPSAREAVPVLTILQLPRYCASHCSCIGMASQLAGIKMTKRIEVHIIILC
jgi:hypothetical protein